MESEPRLCSEKGCYNEAFGGTKLCEVHREKALERMRAWHEANREKERERQRAWYEANREKVIEQQRAYREANREKVLERQRAYRARKKLEREQAAEKESSNE